jgi:CubicO group peptidase (beta-lactamase class C family)
MAAEKPVTEINHERAAELVDATGDQEQRFAQAFALLDDAIARRVFPGAALAVTMQGRLLAWRAFGRLTYEASSPEASPEVQREAVWDLASLTKPIATTSMAMLLHERGSLLLDAPIVKLLPEFANPLDLRREAVTARMLLEHSSGLPAHRKLYLGADGREAMLSAAARVPLEAAPGDRSEYSDLGFILLGELLEKLAGEREDVFCQRKVFDPLKLNFRFAPHPRRPVQFPPTVIDADYRGRIIQGEVNDENASAMTGVAGHAGLFGDALSVARFADCILRGGLGLFRPETVRLFTTRATLPAGTSRTMGWDTPSAPSQSGTRFSARSFGHLGYTGTSLWCDPERGVSVTMLTNRTWPDATNQAIKEVRPAVHDAILECVDRIRGRYLQ